jgi:hypothetical protein
MSRLGDYNLPDSIREKLLDWKVEHGHLYIAQFRKQRLSETGQYETDALAPWLFAILRELKLKEYMAYCDIATYDNTAAAFSLVRRCLLTCENENGEHHSISNEPHTMDYLFGVLVSMSGFFEGKVHAAQVEARASYGKLYKNFIVPLISNYGFSLDYLGNSTDTDIAEIAIILQKQRRERPPINGERDKTKALTLMSADHSSELLREKMEHDRNGGGERINTDVENLAIRANFGEIVTNRPVPDVTKLKKFDPKTMMPKFTHKKVDGR